MSALQQYVFSVGSRQLQGQLESGSTRGLGSGAGLLMLLSDCSPWHCKETFPDLQEQLFRVCTGLY